MKKVVWKNKTNEQLCITIPKNSGIKDGDIVELKKSTIKKIAYIGIVGDLFHYGHLQSIKFAKSIADYLICGVLTDNAVEKYRTKPIANLQERKAVISSLSYVDRVITQHSRDHTENLKKIHEEFPDAKLILVHGADLNEIPGSEYIRKIGGETIKHPYYARLSTVKIVNQIVENQNKFKDILNFSSLIKGEYKIDSEYKKGNKILVSTKADTLKTLKDLLKKSKIEKLFVFSTSDWKNNKDRILKNIKEKFSPEKIIIRSSTLKEDTLNTSMAGCFKSILNINPDDIKQTEIAIKKVIDSYTNKKSESSFNQILIQSYTQDVVMSGVIFTRMIDTNAPYYLINYDDSTGKTDTVTKGIEYKTIKISRFVGLDKVPYKFRNLLDSVKEIESIIPDINLDIEFAINKKKEIIIFQVRPLIKNSLIDINDNLIKNKIETLINKFQELSKPKNSLAGEKNIFADMPDWNPAEILGHAPNHLDYSLYNYIITEEVWHEARTSQGYYNVAPAKLVVLFGNKPYIDVRNSFNSFIPNTLSPNLRSKLIQFYLNKLKKNPELQDKVEFEILYTCYDLSFNERSNELVAAGFSKDEIIELKNALINLTNNLITNSKKSIQEDLKSLREMERNEEKIKETLKLPYTHSINNLLDNAKFLLDDCKKKGTVQFSRLARLAFIGKIFLKSLIVKKVIDEEFYNKFMNSINTIATELKQDFKLLKINKITKQDFIKKYAHLRPGTYNIVSLRYDSNSEFLKVFDFELSDSKPVNFILNTKTEEKITKILMEEGLEFNASELLEFVKTSIKARELAKFKFTKNLSDAIELIALAGREMGFTRQELAKLDIKDLFLKREESREELTKSWKKIIFSKMDEENIDKFLELPPLIFSEEDFHIIKYYSPQPNYITQKKIKSKLVKLDTNSSAKSVDIDAKIVMIENADPGYDWIFTRNPAGLITKYGGVASHMSIRCAEFDIPAAIGCGIIFDNLINFKEIILDCGIKKITPYLGE